MLNRPQVSGLVLAVSLLVAAGAAFCGPEAHAQPRTAQAAPPENPFARVTLTGIAAGAAEMGDVNEDGLLDLLLVWGRLTTLYLGTGEGRFVEVDAGLTDVVAAAAAIGDVNGDGHEDLVIAGLLPDRSPSTALYYGDGAGGFAQADAGLMGLGQGSISIGDLDQNGAPDILITGENAAETPTTALYLQDQNGSFSRANAGLPGVYDYGSTSIADVDADGNLDLLLTGGDPNEDRIATLRLGHGDGTFSAAGAGLSGVSKGSTAIADLDGDGHLDLLIAGRDNDFDTTTSLYLGDGQGGFATTTHPFPNVSFGSTSIGDIDADANPDVLLTGLTPDDRIATLYLGDGEGAFSQANDGLTGVSSSSSAVGDADGDGHLDLLLTGEDVTDNYSTTLYRGNGHGGFSVAGPNLPSLTEGSSAFGDIDGDGHLDLLVTGEANLDEDRDTEHVSRMYLGDGDGGFERANAGLTGVAEGSSTIGHVNGDGHLDLLLTGTDGSSATAAVYLGSGDGTFTTANAGLTGVSEGSSSVADVNGDGDVDLLITGEDESGDPSATLYLGDGQGGFAEANAGLSGVGGGSTSIGDVNNDGHVDLLIAGSDASFNPTVALYLGSDGGTFDETDAGLTPLEDPATGMADLDGDGNLDLVTAGKGPDGDATATVHLGDGQGGFTEAGTGLVGVADGSVSIGDVNADQHLDLVLTGDGDDVDETSRLYLGNGQGGFTEAERDLVPVTNSSSSLGDIDGDGDLDLILTGDDPVRRTTLYENRTEGDASGTSSQAVGTDGSAGVGATGVHVHFSAASGSGSVGVQRVETRAPAGTRGIDQSTGGSYRGPSGRLRRARAPGRSSRVRERGRRTEPPPVRRQATLEWYPRPAPAFLHLRANRRKTRTRPLRVVKSADLPHNPLSSRRVRRPQ